jgi:hypothetical protein
MHCHTCSSVQSWIGSQVSTARRPLLAASSRVRRACCYRALFAQDEYSTSITLSSQRKRAAANQQGGVCRDTRAAPGKRDALGGRDPDLAPHDSALTTVLGDMVFAARRGRWQRRSDLGMFSARISPMDPENTPERRFNSVHEWTVRHHRAHNRSNADWLSSSAAR